MTNEISTNSAKAWWLAARPKTLTAAAMPVLIGCAIALTADSFQWTPAILCLLFAFLMQIDANLINDLFDYKKGSDRQDRLGPERACVNGNEKCTDFGNWECTDFGNNNAPISVTTIHNFR